MSTDVATLEQEAASLTTEATALAVIDAGSFERASEFLKAVATYIKRVGDVLDPIVDAAHQAHKIAVRQRDALLGPAKSAKVVLGGRMEAWEQEQARLRREAEERAQRERERLEREAREQAEAEQRRLQAEAETRRLEEAAALEEAGDREGAERLVAAPVPVATIAPAPVFAPRPMVAAPPKVEGVAFRSDWKAEVTDLAALVRAVAAGQAPITLLQANQVALNGMARALKGALNLPGVKAVESRIASVRA
jgi:ATPase subunit of ABC transporter with duplicated ATPase domains